MAKIIVVCVIHDGMPQKTTWEIYEIRHSRGLGYPATVRYQFVDGPYEVLRLEWTGIQFQTREIRIEPAWTKTHRARIIPLAANALEWLKLIAAHTPEKAGRVMPLESTWNNRWRRWRGEEDAPLPFAWWVGKGDILRHSYGTYRAAILRNSHNLAEEMGNSVTMVRTYYDAVVSPSVAKLWWNIWPARPKNVVQMDVRRRYGRSGSLMSEQILRD
jgi:integrase